MTGVLLTAEATILDNGNPIGQATATNPGELLVPVTTPPVVGHAITAVQKTADGTSEPSSQPIIVVDLPNPLPVPVIVSALNTCMTDIWASGLVPGATVVTMIGGQPFGSSVPGLTLSTLGIDRTKPITANTQAQIHQEAVVGGAQRVSNTVTSPNIPQFTTPGDLLPPPVLGPLVQCDTERHFQQAVPGAITTITNEGQSEGWINPLTAFNCYGGPPLRKGTAVATQEMPRCKRAGQPVTLPVAPAETPIAPTASQDVCPQALRLSVSGLAPGGILHVKRRVQQTNGFSETDLGDLGIEYETQPVDLPTDLKLTDPNGPVKIALSQQRCGGVSPVALVSVAPVAGPFGAPKIVEPLFDCSRGIPITGAHPSSLVQAFDAAAGTPLSDPVAVTTASMLLTPWFPLAGGHKVQVRQHGCNANGTSPDADVKPLPQPIPVPTIVTPVRPQAAWIKVTGVLPGARLYLLVNNELRPASIDIYATQGVVPVTGAPLAENDSVFVIQKLCDQSSNPEGKGAVVTRGNLKVTVTPSTVPRGTTSMVTVHAVDADTGAAVSADVLLNGQHVGTTGNPFAYSPQVGATNPNGLVHDGPAYNDAAFSITLVDPTWAIDLRAGPVPAWLETLRIDVTQVIWKVTPDWNTSLAKTVTVSPNPPTAAGSVTLPRPTGAVKTVTVAISGTCQTNGGDVNGISVPAQTFPLGTDSKKVAFTGSDETIGWLLQVDYVYDPNSGILAFKVDPYLAGIQP
ncbi:hypothetical protein [Mycobacterium sp.]|uniref:hypothetical protein n=1 Tax=Mycobacterium sp. TaxID=1785 RepID=UPI003F9D9CE6